MIAFTKCKLLDVLDGLKPAAKASLSSKVGIKVPRSSNPDYNADLYRMNRVNVVLNVVWDAMSCQVHFTFV